MHAEREEGGGGEEEAVLRLFITAAKLNEPLANYQHAATAVRLQTRFLSPPQDFECIIQVAHA